MYKRFDEGAILLVESFCQRQEKISGKTNFFFLEVLTGFYAVLLGIFLFVVHVHLGTGTERHTILVGGMMVSFFTVSFWYAPIAKTRAEGRRNDGIQNPAKQCKGHFMYRLVMLLNALLPVMVLFFLSFTNSAFIITLPVISFVFTICCSFVLFWTCFLLDACDPLP